MRRRRQWRTGVRPIHHVGGIALGLGLLWSATAAAADFTIRALLHGVAVGGRVHLDPRQQVWTLEVQTDVGAPRRAFLSIEGTYLILANGNIEGRTPYANARVVIRPIAAGAFSHVSSTVDFQFTSIVPLP